MKKKIIFSILFILIVIFNINISSYATFEINNFFIDANLTPDGNLQVTETITYYTDEIVNGLTRKIITQNPRNTQNSADSLELYSVQVDDEYCRQIEVGSKGDDGVFEYSYNGKNEYNIKLYSPFTSSYKTIKYNYMLKNVAVKYNDIGEIFWNFVGDEWDCNIYNLTIRVTLPELAANDKIYVFGHGSDNGTFTKTNNFITLQAKFLDAYQPLDARILFSRNAISDSTKIINKNVLDKYIYEEEGLSEDMESPKIIWNLNIYEISGILSIIIIVIGLGCYFLFDKEIRVEKTKYYREMPFGLEPELLQYIYYRKIKSNSFYIAVLNLIKLGVYKLENTVNQVGKETQKIIYNPNYTANLKDYQKHIIKIINGFLKEDSNGEKSLDLIKLSSKMSRSSSRGFNKYKSDLEAEKETLVGKPTKIPSKIIVMSVISMLALIGIITLIGMNAMEEAEMVFVLPFMMIFITFVYSLLFATLQETGPVIIFLLFHCACFQGAIIGMMIGCKIGILYIPYLLMFILIQYLCRIKKFPREERQIIEYIKGLKRYIKHYSLLNQKDSLDYIEIWEDYFIMAIALDLNNKTINYFYNYGKEQNSNLGYSMRYTNSYMNFHYDMYNSCYNYQKSSSTSSSGRSSSSYSGSSGGFSGGSSSGGGGGRWRWWKPFLKLNARNSIILNCELFYT